MKERNREGEGERGQAKRESESTTAKIRSKIGR
jgi:hypothetical protein